METLRFKSGIVIYTETVFSSARERIDEMKSILEEYGVKATDFTIKSMLENYKDTCDIRRTLVNLNNMDLLPRDNPEEPFFKLGSLVNSSFHADILEECCYSFWTTIIEHHKIMWYSKADIEKPFENAGSRGALFMDLLDSFLHLGQVYILWLCSASQEDVTRPTYRSAEMLITERLWRPDESFLTAIVNLEDSEKAEDAAIFFMNFMDERNLLTTKILISAMMKDMYCLFDVLLEKVRFDYQAIMNAIDEYASDLAFSELETGLGNIRHLYVMIDSLNRKSKELGIKTYDEDY